MPRTQVNASSSTRSRAKAAPPPPAATIPAAPALAWLTVRGARHNNLQNIDVAIPLGRFVCVTGVSGSGKSSLVNDILHEALAQRLNGATTAQPGAHDALEGLEHLDKVIAIDQTPIGRTPRSNPATYIKVFDEVRDLFTRLPDAKLRGYAPGRFSFNVASGPKGGGRCEACEGNGANRVEMDFLADVWVTCPVCEGRRFARETLQIRYGEHQRPGGYSIGDVLELDVLSALRVFENQPRIRAMLQTLHDVGLDYIQLGQPSTTLSGGEAQRIKLARELVKKPTGRTLYVLDEPTTGLHFADIHRLLTVLHGFVDAGNSVLVIEHNTDVIKTADWVIDLGPEGGAAGGRIIVAGTPEDVAASERSFTGQALRSVLRGGAEFGGARGASPAVAERPTPTPPAADGLREVVVRGARQHNLKELTVSFPRDQMTVCTGVSGSGKTSFAIDTVFTEGYRRYVESLSAYARQFLGQMAKPAVEHVEGLSPAICIEQKAASRSPRSTVGTITEIYDYMRVLWARVGRRYCPRCQIEVGTQTVDQIVERILAHDEGTPIILLAPLSLNDGESYAGLFNRLKSSGYTRLRVDGQIVLTTHASTLDARTKHRVEVVIDRTVVRRTAASRITESVEHALALGNGLMILLLEEVEVWEDQGAGNGEQGTGIGEPGNGELGAADGREAATAGPAPADAAPGSIRRTPPREFLLSQKLACTQCGTSYEELAPHHFSFNSGLGWCDTCEGLGVQRGAPAAAIIRRPERGLLRGALAGWNEIPRRSPLGQMLTGVCAHLGLAADTPLSEWSPAQRQVLLYGSDAWIDAPGLFGKAARAPGDGLRFQWRGLFPTIDLATRNSWTFRHRLRNVVTDIACLACRGGRLRPDAAAVRLAGRTIVEVCTLPLSTAVAFFGGLDQSLSSPERKIAGELLKEIRDRLRFLIDVGLEYLTLHRSAPTLSGGEAQRIRLASQIGSGLSGVLYVLDEPTIGLHPRDNARLIRALMKLRDLGNTLLLVEHDRDVIRSADRLLDFGPGAGRHGGRIMASGPPGALRLADTDAGERSLTQEYLTGVRAIATPANRRPIEPDALARALAPREEPAQVSSVKKTGRSVAAARRTGASPKRPAEIPPQPDGPVPGWLVIRGARQHNLKNLTVPVPLGRLVAITGVSGSGKSSLVSDILWPALARTLNNADLPPGDHEQVDGIGLLDKVVNVDQSPLGATPSSNPATYTGVFDWMRELFARLPDAKVRGYNANRFSFNRPGGRCEPCQGLGQRCIEMHFMPDVWVECETCRGQRYNPETLEVKFKGKSIAEVLQLSVAQALELFENVPRIRRMLQTLADVGLEYVQLGQSATTLSGGEAQRVKLAAELGKPDTGRTLYILDEPTTGLHFDDVRKLLEVLHRLVDLGNTVLVVEHNLDVLKNADWLIDLGPEAGDAGGELVALGTPEDVAKLGRRAAGAGEPRSHTADALAPVLAAGPLEPRPRFDPQAHAAELIRAEKSGLGKVGQDVKPPWVVDGRKWHLEQRTSREGKPTHWEAAALEYVVELVQKSGTFAPTNWNERASVEITAAGAEHWFLHALTGGEWLLELYFIVPRGTFDARRLDRDLGLKTLDQRAELPVYGDWPRVDVRKRQGGCDAVVIYAYDKAEIDTPAFRRFVRAAARAYSSREST